jgi:hypothetical protein
MTTPARKAVVPLAPAGKNFLDLSDDDVERLLAGARANSPETKDQLLNWAYLTAHQYF